jgi:hypothetical protein
MKTLWFKILIVFLGIAVFENIAFPIMAIHGRIDIQNRSMQPYLFLSALGFAGIVLLFFIIYKKPSANTGLYILAKFVIPLMVILLIINVTDLIPIHFTFSSTLIFALHVFGILVSLWVAVGLFTNKVLTK